jgi:hypothetical protein
MYTRETAEQQAAAKPLSQISPEQQARVDTIKTDLQRATHSQGQNVEAPPPAPQDGAENPQPMAQKSMNQDKAAPELSPTSAQAGTRSTEQETPTVSEDTSRSPEHSPDRARTIARTTPSWER